MYDKNYYDTKKKKIEEKFNQVKSQLDQANQQVKGLTEEMLRLQGEHRAIEEMEKEQKSEVAPELTKEQVKEFENTRGASEPEKEDNQSNK